MNKTLSFSRTRPHRRVRARVQASTHSFGGTAQERTLDGLLYLEALKVKTPGQQTVLSVANTYGKVQELKTSNRSDTSGSASSVKNSQYTYDHETRLTQTKTDTGGLFGTDTENPAASHRQSRQRRLGRQLQRLWQSQHHYASGHCRQAHHRRQPAPAGVVSGRGDGAAVQLASVL